MVNIIQKVKNKELKLDIIAIISNKINPEAFHKAEDFNISVIYLGSKSEEFEQRLGEFIYEKQIELIILAGFMKILSKEFVRKFPKK
ncbi:MAG: phosphoribosylglycinamide formyltransferase, partial [Candidatus Muirbacterium halophilum]|nr:phosphoribosylglycinamide formyltransferase [Candidatus Muirbacterium halophilum]